MNYTKGHMSVTIMGIFVLIVSQFFPVEEAETVGEAIGIILTWWGRYRIGDITLTGIRK